MRYDSAFNKGRYVSWSQEQEIIIFLVRLPRNNCGPRFYSSGT